MLKAHSEWKFNRIYVVDPVREIQLYLSKKEAVDLANELLNAAQSIDNQLKERTDETT